MWVLWQSSEDVRFRGENVGRTFLTPNAQDVIPLQLMQEDRLLCVSSVVEAKHHARARAHNVCWHYDASVLIQLYRSSQALWVSAVQTSLEAARMCTALRLVHRTHCYRPRLPAASTSSAPASSLLRRRLPPFLFESSSFISLVASLCASPTRS